MPALKNVRQEAFAQAFARGGNATRAYMAVYVDAKPNCAQAAGSRLSRRPDVVSRVQELRNEKPKLAVMDNIPVSDGDNNGPTDHDKGLVDLDNESRADARESPSASGSPGTGEPIAAESERPTAGSPGTVLDAEVVEPETASAMLTREELRDVYTRWGRARKLVQVWDKLLTVIFERARDPEMADVPGGRTGMVTLTYRTVGNRQVVKESRVDTALVAQLQSLLEQTAQELGQHYEHRVIPQSEMTPPQQDGPDFRLLSTERLIELRGIVFEATELTERARKLAAPENS